MGDFAKDRHACHLTNWSRLVQEQIEDGLSSLTDREHVDADEP